MVVHLKVNLSLLGIPTLPVLLANPLSLTEKETQENKSNILFSWWICPFVIKVHFSTNQKLLNTSGGSMLQMQDDFYCQDCFASFFLFERNYIRSFVSFVIFVGFFLDFEDHTKQSFFLR